MHSQSSLSRIAFFGKRNKLRPQLRDDCSGSRAKNSLRHFIIVLFYQFLIVGWAAQICGQEPDRVVAKVNGAPITLREIDATAINKIFSLQQQIFALRKAALENLISRRVLETEAARKRLSAEELANQLLALPVTVSASQVEELYTENLSAFAS